MAHPIPPEKRVCDRCDSEFIATDARRKYCSENCRKRACAERNRAMCIDCGEPLAEGSAWRGYVRCAECYAENHYLQHRWRDLLIEEWWGEGLSMAEIASRLGWTTTHLGVEMHRLRDAGYDLPYRYQTGKRAGRRFPEQVAA